MHAASSARLALPAQLGAGDRTPKLLLLSDLGFNLGFYMLVPYLAGHLHDLAMPAWTIGLILGLRNLSQQGLFIIGGALADRGEYRSIIVAGCGLRFIAFALFGLARTLPALIAAAVLTGVAAALFTPALKAYLSVAARDRRPRAFALSAVLSQVGALLGPLAGMLALMAGFTYLALIAALIFLGHGIFLAVCLPARRGSEVGSAQSMWQDWRRVLGDGRFVAFSIAMSGYAILFNQLYLALPLTLGTTGHGQAPVGIAFMISALMVIAMQVRVTAFVEARWRPSAAIAAGLVLMGAAFAPLAAAAVMGAGSMTPAAIAATVILTMGMMLAFPFTMNMIPIMAGERRLGVYYGVYYLAAGIAGAIGNVLVGVLIEVRGQDLGSMLWLALVVVGLASAAAIWALDRRAQSGSGAAAVQGAS